jgi:beta-aspartyl-peptidase (threonine type)
METTSMNKAVLAIHGGAGTLSREGTPEGVRNAYQDALRGILREAGLVLEQGGSALDTVTQAVRLLEECPLFNAGHGAVLTSAGTHELDAAIMDGHTLNSGAVANVRTVRNPVLAARAVMECSPHVMFVAEGAESFARMQGLECVAPAFFSTPLRREQLLQVQRASAGRTALDHDAETPSALLSFPSAPLDERRKLGTVGAVACDAQGHLAAATSTGGMTNKQPGRVGDSAIIGAGCYADDHTCAISTTGTGEMFIRMVAAHDIAARLEYGGASLEDATQYVIHQKLPRIGGRGGLVAVDAQGHVCMPFNTEGMYRGFIQAGQIPVVAIYR